MPKITFTRAELLELQWLVKTYGASSLSDTDAEMLNLKLTKMLEEDGDRLVIYNASDLRH